MTRHAPPSFFLVPGKASVGAAGIGHSGVKLRSFPPVRIDGAIMLPSESRGPWPDGAGKISGPRLSPGSGPAAVRVRGIVDEVAQFSAVSATKPATPSRHPGLDPGSRFSTSQSGGAARAWPESVEGAGVTKWDRKAESRMKLRRIPPLFETASADRGTPQSRRVDCRRGAAQAIAVGDRAAGRCAAVDAHARR